MNQKTLLDLARKHGTPLFVVDHAELRKNYALFRRHFPRVQVYYAVKVNSDPAIVETFHKLGGSFDVASIQEFRTVYQFIAKLPHDIIGGQPLKYRRTADGQFVLYSIGWNEKDDGGVPGKTDTEGDWVWRPAAGS